MPPAVIGNFITSLQISNKMKVNKIYDITFDTDNTIMTSTLSKSNEIVMLMSSGSVVRVNLDDKNIVRLFSVKNNINYTDGGFDLTAKTSIYTMDEIVVIVNDFKSHGFVHYPGLYYALHLFREDYHAQLTKYPIALYKNDIGAPHLIYGEAWNHIQIMNLRSRQILTAAKSLIEEDAEERHIEFYSKYSEDNKLAWPRPYNYFFGKLFVSPNQKKFLSAGWNWGSADCYNVYDIENFINSNRISDLNIGIWEHEYRATCWLDNETIAVVYNPSTEEDENATPDSPCEIHFYRIVGNNIQTVKKIQITDESIVSSRLYFNAEMNAFIAVSNQNNLSVISLDGQIIFEDKNLKVDEYSVETGRFLVVDNKTISVYELTEC